MGRASLASVTVSKPYNESTDLANYTGEGKIYTIPQGSLCFSFLLMLTVPTLHLVETKW
jgi:hypothetical protein